MHDAVPLLHDYLTHAAARVPEKVALVCGPRRITYGALAARAHQMAWALRRRGVRRGDRVLVFVDNTVEFAISFWGVLGAGAVAVPINPLTRTDKLAWLLNDCTATALITQAQLAPVFAPAARQAPSLAAVLIAGPPEAESIAGLPGVADFDTALEAERGDAPPPRQGIDLDLSALIYTSGSTGEPKGVMLTHRNMLTAASSISQYLGLREDDVILCAMPLAFDYGLYQMLMSVRQGARLVLERSSVLPAQLLKQVELERVTVVPGVPTLFMLLAQMADRVTWDRSSVRTVTSSGAALQVQQIATLGAMFPHARIFSMYGLTECKRCTYLPPEELARRPGSVGIAIPNTELWLVDEQGNRLGPHQVGQLVIRGATVMQGYWGKPEESAQRLKPGPLPGERVLYTGDLCRLDEEGFLYFVGRMDDIIKSRGEKVAPAEVEAAIYTIPGVKEVAVIGVPDDILGRAVKAFVVLEDGSALTERELRHECQQLLEGFMVPRYFELTSSLPRTQTGKLSKKGLSPEGKRE
jgi:amino acid adenylation domain-containing protein